VHECGAHPFLHAGDGPPRHRDPWHYTLISPGVKMKAAPEGQSFGLCVFATTCGASGPSQLWRAYPRAPLDRTYDLSGNSVTTAENIDIIFDFPEFLKLTDQSC
jgi:hypothetical protein